MSSRAEADARRYHRRKAAAEAMTAALANRPPATPTEVTYCDLCGLNTEHWHGNKPHCPNHNPTTRTVRTPS